MTDPVDTPDVPAADDPGPPSITLPDPPPAADPIPPLAPPPSVEPKPDPTWDEVKTAKIGEINLTAQRFGSAFLVGYPDLERLTWPQQVAEATRWAADPNSGPFPVCEAINARRGLAFSDFMQRTSEKVLAFQRVAGLIVGERQRLEDAVSALVEDTTENRAALAALAWTVTQDDLLAALAPASG